ncbi:serine hydrolase [Massilia dura]|uniref:Serine hydrolase n=1 Tax=Pseudoduganella dura TaxID=321982 RepID=A0A6I3X6I3_9BURK|nr:serine hydrolase domain-containing protein [Pseudoduganella dura]MUI11376.1 serine hydrolase [Pseudoduganella dura]GGX95761.1 serine hydrolase [Pseudoduganella dura]
MNQAKHGALSEERLAHLRSVIENDVRKGLYYGAVIRVARAGEIGLDATVGSADAEGAHPLASDAVFSIFSLTKAFVNVLALRAVEHGQLALTTRVADIIPEFAGAPRDRATLYHLLTHTTGMPGVWTPKPDMLQDNLAELLQAVCANVHGAVEPGSRCDYSPVSNHVLMAEMLRRTDAADRDIVTILQDDLCTPLRMDSTSLGVRADLRARKVVPDMRGVIPIRIPGRTQPGTFGLFEEERNEAPHVGAVSTTADISRFAEMLRRGGELDGARILSPRMVAMASRNQTGELPNELYKGVALRSGWEAPPAYIGLGFSVRGERIVHHQFGTMTSPGTFGNYGAGSTMFWIDPALHMTFACLTTGVMTQAANIERFQRLSDIAVSAAL